jgi:surface antigen
MPSISVYKPRATLDGYCVSYVQQYGFEAYKGNANEWIKYINSTEPSIGAVVVLKEGPMGHLALVIDYTGEKVFITEQNYLGRGIVSTRWIDRNYPKIIGYIKVN